MKLTILSDIHDNVWNLKKALAGPAVQQTDALLCCGDLCAPFIIRLLGEGYARPIHIVLGNNDGDVASIIRVADNFEHVHLHGEYFRGEFGGRTLAMNHYPIKGRILAESGQYDVVCYGHDHQLNRGEKTGNTLLLNPGAIMGYNGAALKDIPATYMVLDTGTLEARVFGL
ncbi:MAG: YfcE family phosphodiesterase [Phaeodactylibacter sp.]|nr:YfcE family phosphodiesterase [Phaeodactylibacter sp.]